MPHLSRYKLSTGQIEHLAERIVGVVLRIRDRKGLLEFFDDLLTTTEKAMLGKRMLIAFFLEHGHSYAEISNVLKVSETTIGMISERLQHGGRGFRLAIQKLEREEEFEKIIQATKRVFQKIKRMRMPPKIGPGRWHFLDADNEL